MSNLVLEHIANLAPIFSEAWRVLRPGGTLYLCELHPYRQLRGATARFQDGEVDRRVEAYVHVTSEYVRTALKVGFELADLTEPSGANERGLVCGGCPSNGSRSRSSNGTVNTHCRSGTAWSTDGNAMLVL